MLPSAVAMLPTPRATRGGSGTETVAVLNHSSHPSLEQAVEISQGEMPRELTSWDEAPGSWQLASTRSFLARTRSFSEEALFAAPEQAGADNPFGKYTAAITRHERALGQPAPAPTITGARGGKKLNPAFVEWMMMLPPGQVTAVPGVTVNEMLAMLGNGVVPAQAAAALRFLLTREAVSGA
jgi:DNA (cytosine-5)-methyltransferase 1